jgi:hypothetical protein
MPDNVTPPPLYVVRVAHRLGGAVEYEVVDVSEQPRRIVAAHDTRKAAEAWIARAYKKQKGRAR